MFHVEHYACEYRKYVVSLHLRIAIFFFIVEWWRVVGSVTAFFSKKGNYASNYKERGTNYA